MKQKIYSLDEASASLTDLVKDLQVGECILLTEGRKVVARILPPEGPTTADAQPGLRSRGFRDRPASGIAARRSPPRRRD